MRSFRPAPSQGFLANDPERIRSIANRDWARVNA